MARPETLVPGNCYFHVAYYDKARRLPTIETFVYVGEDVHPETGSRGWLFKEPDGDVPDGEEPQPGAYQFVDCALDDPECLSVTMTIRFHGRRAVVRA